MAPILFLLFGVLASANQGVPSGVLYPGLLNGGLGFKASPSDYKVPIRVEGSEFPLLSKVVLQNGTTEDYLETTEGANSQITEQSSELKVENTTQGSQAPLDSNTENMLHSTKGFEISTTESLIDSTPAPAEDSTTENISESTELPEGDMNESLIQSTELPEDITQSTQAEEVETEESVIQGTQVPTIGSTQVSDVEMQSTQDAITDIVVQSTQMSPNNSNASAQLRDIVIKTLPRESESDNEIANTYYEVDRKQTSDVINIVHEREGSHPCVRECRPGAPAMRCYYHFELEWYHTMSKACYSCPGNRSDCERKHCVTADGVRRPIIVVNRQLPGPTIEVCKGDIITVDVENSMMEETTTIHWHGQHQKGTPYMDGVPYVTQCPIAPKSTFRYHFQAETPGTHFWHSHTGCQRADGMFGALIVHKPRSEDPHSNLYDFDQTEHVVQILDWGHESGIEKFLAHHHSNGDNKPVSLLVNGRGWVGGLGDVPAATFTVEQGYRYRFRLINAGFLNCPIEMSVDNHTITVISSDGRDFHPVQATSLVSYAGERFDFVLEANQSITNYWIRFRGLMDCDERFTSTHQVAVLHYKDAPIDEKPQGTVDYKHSHRHGQQVNSLNVGTGTDLSTVIPELDAIEDDDVSLKEKPDMQIYISYDFYAIDNPHYHRSPYYRFWEVPDKNQRLYTPQLNHISMKLPSFPLLSERDSLSPSMFCNESTVSNWNCEKEYCECTHMIQVPLGDVVELILVDKGETYDANHPFHLHGHAFRVVAMDRVRNFTSVEEIKELDRQGKIKRKLHGAPLKDTVTVPDGGYTVVRIHASNPGYWLFHCHIEFHVELGMSIVFKVGEHSDITPVPRGFPQCRNYLPDEDLDLEVEQITDTDNEVPFLRFRQESSSSSSLKERTVASCLVLALLLLVHLR